MGSHRDTNPQVEQEARLTRERRQRGKGPFPQGWFSSLLSQEPLEQAASLGETGALNF